MGFTSSLFHLDGANGATVYPNDGDSGLAFSNIPSGIAAITTSDSVFGGASLENGADGSLGGLISNRKVWLRGDFTLKVRFRTANNAFNGAVLSIGDQTLNPLSLMIRLNSDISSAGDIRVSSGGKALIISAAASVSNGTWAGIMLERIGNVLYLGIDGAYQGCALYPGPIGGDYIVLGNFINNGSYAGNGSSYAFRHDEFQFTDGLARHKTLPYVVETAAFRRDGRKDLTPVQLRRRRMDMFNMMATAVAANANASHTDLPTTQSVTVGTTTSITWLQTSALQYADATTTFTPTISGIAAGQLLVLAVSQENTGTSTTQSPAVTTPSGWNVGIANAGAIATVARTGLSSQAVFWKIASGTSDSASLSSTNSAWWAGTISAYAVNGAVALGATNHAENTGTATSINTGSVTPSTPVSLIVAVANATSNGAMSALAGPTSGFTQLGLNTDNLTHTDHASGYKILSTASAQSGGFTWTSASYASAAIASFTVNGAASANSSHTDQSTAQAVTVGVRVSAGVNRTEASTTQNATAGGTAGANASHTDLSTTQVATVFHTFSANASHTDLSTTQVVTVGSAASASGTHTDLGTSQAVTVGAVASANASHTDLGTTQVATVAQVLSINASHTDLSTTQTVTTNHGGSNADASHTDLSTTQVVTITHPGNASASHTDLATTQVVTVAAVASANASHTDLPTSQAVTVAAIASANASHTDLSTTQVATAVGPLQANASHTDLSTTQAVSVTHPGAALVTVSRTDLSTTQVATATVAGGVNASHPDLSTTQVVTVGVVVSANVNRTDLPTSQVATVGAVASANASHTDLSTTQVALANHGGSNANASHTDLSTTQVVTLSGTNGANASHTDLPTTQVVTLLARGTITVNRVEDSTTQVAILGVNLAYAPSDTEVFIVPEQIWVVVGLKH